ncbi:MAG: phenylalanine--tRNA ligase subunit alpha [Acidobacteriia bacterium]|nr:phenylalanine--tRNA ligase subunit alpha [Terriglobia bacterium]
MYTVPKLEDFTDATLVSAVNECFDTCHREAQAVSNEPEYKAFRDRWLGRKNGILTQINELWLRSAAKESKRDVGAHVNELRLRVEVLIKGTELDIADRKSVESERLDVTLPGIRRPLGAEHPIVRTMNDIVGVFKAMGYSVAEGPEIETDYYNFESLNFPPDHPARDMQDTIFLAGQAQKPARDRLLLRTHTSPVQIRTMEKQKPPVRVVIPGRVYRNDAPDATHSPMFHQVEGLAVDTNMTFCDLKGSLDHAMKSLFGSSVKTRFRPSFFPFTEPSAEVLISCIFCGGGGYQGSARCPNCKTSGWIELLGSGMVDPALYGFVGYDPEKVSGFAFGMGVDRIAAMLYGVTDLQLFFNGDVRFLEQFS